MAQGTISSELTIATAVSTLGDLLAPIPEFTLNITNEVVGRQAKVVVPVVSTEDVARDYDATKGYSVEADTGLTTLDVNLSEAIKPFQLSDNEMNKSPISLASFAKQNAHEFGRYLLNKIFTAVDAATITNTRNVAAGSLAVSHVKAMQKELDAAGAPLDRCLLANAAGNSNLMPDSIETFGAGVLESGRFSNLYGMRVFPQSANNDAAGKVHTMASSSDAIVIVNRQPEVSGTATLEEYTPFTIDGIGLQCAYRRYYDASKGQHFGAFTSMFGVGVAKPTHIAVCKKA